MTHKAISHKPKSLFHLDASLQKESINPEIQFNLFSFSLYFYAFPIVTYRKKITTLFMLHIQDYQNVYFNTYMKTMTKPCDDST
jgi:hypothetical protein